MGYHCKITVEIKDWQISHDLSLPAHYIGFKNAYSRKCLIHMGVDYSNHNETHALYSFTFVTVVRILGMNRKLRASRRKSDNSSNC